MLRWICPPLHIRCPRQVHSKHHEPWPSSSTSPAKGWSRNLHHRHSSSSGPLLPSTTFDVRCHRTCISPVQATDILDPSHIYPGLGAVATRWKPSCQLQVGRLRHRQNHRIDNTPPRGFIRPLLFATVSGTHPVPNCCILHSTDMTTRTLPPPRKAPSSLLHFGFGTHRRSEKVQAHPKNS